MFQNGSAVEPYLGEFNRYDEGGTFSIFTQNEDDIGKHRTILRGCSRFNQLIELYLYTEVFTNSYPDFVEDLETVHTVNVNETKEYKLPKLSDDEENDKSVVFIDYDLDATKPYPPFMFYNNITQTLTFRADSKWLMGETFHFRVIVKEENSDVVSFSYACQVTVNGTKLEPMDELEFTEISYEMNPIDRYSNTSIVWNQPVNLTFIKENWDELFDVYIKNVTIREHNQTFPLLKWEVVSLGEDNRTMNFTATFYEPYMLGLLIKKSDKLYIHFKYDLLDTKGFFKDEYAHLNGMFFDKPFTDHDKPYLVGSQAKTLYRLFTEECKKDEELEKESPLGRDTKNREKIYKWQRIDLQFDFRNQYMIYFRTFAVKCYWYLCGIVLFQFVFLFLRNVGFLPLWTLVEYMQLCAFIPLYNFRMIPYLYDMFKPFLVSHLVLSNEAYVLKEFENDYFNMNYDYYGLNIAKLGQALFLCFCLGCIVIIVNILIGLVYAVTPKESNFGIKMKGIIGQFRYNAYIRFYMLSYFDLTFFAVMKYVEGNQSTKMRKYATIASYVIITLSAVVPIFLMTIVCRRFEVMKIKHAKESFNTVVLKIDKQSRWRLIVPGYFFFRRLLTAVLLSMPIDNTFIFL